MYYVPDAPGPAHNHQGKVMIHLSREQMDALAAQRRASQERAWIQSTLRERFGEVLIGVDDARLELDITACLARCDELQITRDGDRMSFCLLDIVLFPGMRDLPGLPAAIAKAREREGSIMMNLMLLAPFETWSRLLERTQDARLERGMP